jgi:hypothetical protein
MAKIRLTQESRTGLVRHAEKLISCNAEKAVVEKAYKLVAPAIRKIIEAKYPSKDMLVLKKYGASHIDDCIRVNLTAGGVDEFKFDKETGPLTACRYCAAYQLDDAATDLFANWKLATEAHTEAVNKKLSDYRSLIRASRNWEDVIEIWPEASQIKPPSPSYALVALSTDAVERIKADVAERKAA